VNESVELVFSTIFSWGYHIGPISDATERGRSIDWNSCCRYIQLQMALHQVLCPMKICNGPPLRELKTPCDIPSAGRRQRSCSCYKCQDSQMRWRPRGGVSAQGSLIFFAANRFPRTYSAEMISGGCPDSRDKCRACLAEAMALSTCAVS
jgi:hypothetical protein